MATILHPAARVELIEAVDHYEAQRTGLGDVFDGEFWALIDRLHDFPEMYAISRWHKAAREGRVRKFPYTVPYLMEGVDLIVFAVAHGSRRPGYWRHRLKQEL